MICCNAITPSPAALSLLPSEASEYGQGSGAFSSGGANMTASHGHSWWDPRGPSHTEGEPHNNALLSLPLLHSAEEVGWAGDVCLLKLHYHNSLNSYLTVYVSPVSTS